MKKKFELGFSCVLVLVLVWLVSQASPWALAQVTGLDLPRGWGPRSGLFPTVIGVPVLVLAVVQLLVSLRSMSGKAESKAPAAVAAQALDLPPEVARQREIAILVTIVGFAVAIWLLGFITAVPLVTFLYLKFPAGESWPMSVGLAAVAGVFFYMVFVFALGVPAPHGPLLAPFFE
jgi:hypothetical protein